MSKGSSLKDNSTNIDPSNDYSHEKKELSNSIQLIHSVDSGVVSTSKPPSLFKRIIDSFKRADPESEDINIDVEAQEAKPNKQISGYQVALIALAGGLGTGLLVGNGKALALGGPIGLIVAYTFVGAMLFCTMLAAGELAVAYSNLAGGFNAYASRLVDPSLGFAIAWNYAINWFTVLPLEMVTASMTIKFWDDSVNSDVYVVIFLILVYSINLFGSKGYARAEVVFNGAKVLMIVGFIILSIVVVCGGVGTQGFIGGKYILDPGPFANGFKGVCAVFVTSTFSLGGTEFMALTAADQANPRKSIPKAVKVVFYRLVFVYLLSILMVGLLVPYNSTSLMSVNSQSNEAPISPYVIAIENAGIKVIPHIINSVILLAILSVGNSALYSSSTTFFSLAQQGFAPQWFNYTDQKGRPIRAMGLSMLFGLFSFIAAYKDQQQVFTWLLSLSGLATIFTWSSISLSHIRFRKALEAQNVNQNTLGFKAKGGIWISYFALFANLFVLIVHFWVSLIPFDNGGKPDAKNFFQNYLGFFTFLGLYIGHKLTISNGRVWFCIKSEEIDLNNGRKLFDADILAQEAQEEETKWRTSSFWQKALSVLY
ncbi:hypothetical protein WICMUC_005880 [Wickerhamomyces mucosus]|uniref:Amino acid permease/ SLC12A domain-containing protein n=1 Tax=Wickerhamomyces mucosus TaxID=1378264 RepID=A0A9P8P2Q7_9ASCO|nr:hypothetical protein WICMUC_005880 [Wickerhamomyces mucosus]